MARNNQNKILSLTLCISTTYFTSTTFMKLQQFMQPSPGGFLEGNLTMKAFLPWRWCPQNVDTAVNSALEDLCRKQAQPKSGLQSVPRTEERPLPWHFSQLNFWRPKLFLFVIPTILKIWMELTVYLWSLPGLIRSQDFKAQLKNLIVVWLLRVGLMF